MSSTNYGLTSLVGDIFVELGKADGLLKVTLAEESISCGISILHIHFAEEYLFN